MPLSGSTADPGPSWSVCRETATRVCVPERGVSGAVLRDAQLGLTHEASEFGFVGWTTSSRLIECDRNPKWLQQPDSGLPVRAGTGPGVPGASSSLRGLTGADEENEAAPVRSSRNGGREL